LISNFLFQISYSQEKVKPNEELKVDKTILSISSEDKTKVATISGRIYGKPFTDSELIIKDKKTPFKLEISDGNFMGIISASSNIKVKIEEFYKGGKVLGAENIGYRILVRRKNNWAATEKLN